ncbi:ABC transporter ATP-binding protein [Halochromatium roseum]|uniref:ABC transporter ATP-binding protein n=1 Tax=Halochromatium roseum TaxID=391920 RepID=UPI00191286D9|nr:ABC transporter ATP-binding protein [Halochromatium roseum]MBK5940360.1 ABC transporter ATP-binding protein [Halochromatium roseum]
MRSTVSKLLRLTNPGSGKRLVLLILLMIMAAFMQVAGIASVMPFLALIGDPDLIHSNPVLAYAYQYLEFDSERSFLFFLGIASFIAFVLGTVLTVTTQWAVTMFGAWQQYYLSRRLMQDYLHRPYEFYLTRNSNDLAKIVLQESSLAINGALTPAMRLLSQALTAIAIIAFLVFISPMLAFTVASALGITYGLIYFISKRWLTAVGRERVAAQRERFVSASEAFVGQKEIRLLGREKDYVDRFGKPSRRLASINAKASLLSDLPEHAIEAIAFGGILLLVLFMMAGNSSLGGMLPILGAYGLAGKKIIPAFQKVFSTFASVRLNMPTVDSVLADLKKIEAGTSGALPFENVIPLSPIRTVSVSGVYYSYPGTDKYALENLTLEIPVNSTVGFVGPSGSGKSTLMDVLLGLLPPCKGALKVDDIEIDASNVRRLQAAIGYVPQHIFLADQSVAANIALGVSPSEVDINRVERAARLSHLHEFIISDLPDGYDTQIGERGVRLSGGQRQRIGIARALYRDPAILVFDEATSALDNATERALMESINELSGSKTIILVAHRLSTVRTCSTIYLLSKGRIAEWGSWDELNSEGTRFASMANG